ncbi:uncharacterized protein TEOVI_000826300 [Trypanosoma equiperdum]|uniref:Uncharacterized protein n=2 Tax=Trypanozoon TaxID=39700 RepID=Q388F2_TRYB2|nr:hypothetical protein, conserved [Trypanosoma brucei brucei TREU927]EAN78818.1 hypothetical protein, conserved [Trypanosoma brucei brucei TREU927]SCU66550.1 hypothetical protein, conserved [Trypanosoma equiperdum]
MSVKLPHVSVQYQSHQHCQCDFCNSRRNLNAKKSALMTTVSHLREQQALHNCCCQCHDSLSQRNYDRKPQEPSFELDDPEHHPNQTELNAKMGRNGLQHGGEYTIPPGVRAAQQCLLNGSNGMAKTREEQEKDAMDDLDRLERLLVLEHKSRVKAAADAENFETLKRTGKGPRPIPFDAPEEQVRVKSATPPQGTIVMPGTVREAYDAAHRCSVTPPPHCEDSHRLQHVIEKVRTVARDPANRDNAAALGAVLHRQCGAGTPPVSREGVATPPIEGMKTIGTLNTYGPRPEGAGVVWCRGLNAVVDDGIGTSAALGNTDNRDLWKATLLKNQPTTTN